MFTTMVSIGKGQGASNAARDTGDGLVAVTKIDSVDKADEVARNVRALGIPREAGGGDGSKPSRVLQHERFANAGRTGKRFMQWSWRALGDPKTSLQHRAQLIALRMKQLQELCSFATAAQPMGICLFPLFVTSVCAQR